MKFWKMHGAGNDFIIINNIEENIPAAELPALAAKLCAPHTSLGADGFMVVEKAEGDADFKMLFFNSDGSSSEMCGNGARCICRYGYENGLSGDIQRIETTAGIVTGYRLGERRYRIRLNDPTKIKIKHLIKIDEKIMGCSYVELGDPGIPHAVMRWDHLADATHEELVERGRAMRFHESFPKGANVNFYDFLGPDHIIERTYERGVEDITLACGTGTGSVVTVLTLIESVSGKGVKVEVPGGTLEVDIDRNTDGSIKNLWLTGPTAITAKGEVFPEEG